MRARLLVNPNAGSAGEGLRSVRDALSRWPGLELLEAGDSSHLAELAAGAAASGIPLVIAAGGDGTIHSVINGIGASGLERVRLGLLPLGTGNDLCRSLAIPQDPLEALSLALDEGARPIDAPPGPRERRIDLIRARVGMREALCANVASGGFSGQVEEVLSDELKGKWGPLSYLRGAASVIPNLREYDTRIAWDSGPPERVAALNVIVANGRTAAGGVRVAPAADPEDGFLDIVVVRYGPLLDLAAVAAKLLAGDYTESDLVFSRRARSLRVESRPGMWFSLDGELASNEAASFSILPGALRVVVGPGYRASPG